MGVGRGKVGVERGRGRGGAGGAKRSVRKMPTILKTQETGGGERVRWKGE